MSGKKLIAIVGVLAVVSFTVAFFVTQMVSGPDGPAPRREEKKAQSPQAAELAVMEKLTLRGDQLEELMRTVKQKGEEVYRRNRQLDQREKRLTVAQDALRKDAQALDNMRVQLAAPLLRLKEMKAQIDNSRITIKRIEAANLKRIAKVYEKMPSEQGGAILTSMCRNNQIEDAAKILHLMSDKGAAKVFGAISDEKINAELFKRLKTMSVEG